jgi:ParB-like chromosome segregation protein Spo0J
VSAAPVLLFHPLSEIFPLIDGEDFDALVDDIRRHGVHEPVVIYQEQILDGRNRYRACLKAGVECRFESYEGNDPAAYVVSLNLRRRHLDESQRAMVAAKLAQLGLGSNQHSEGTSIEGASRLLNVGRASVERAKVVQRDGTAELRQAVESGIVSVSAAADVASLADDQQREIVDRGEQEILKAAKRIRANRTAVHRARWTARIIEISKCNAPLPCDRRYAVLLADPPWKYGVYDAESGMERAAETQYPTLPTEEICAFPVANLATPDAALFLWATPAHLPEVLRVIAAWDFTYRTRCVWVKQSPGIGYWVRNQHEILLIARTRQHAKPARGRASALSYHGSPTGAQSEARRSSPTNRTGVPRTSEN